MRSVAPDSVVVAKAAGGELRHRLLETIREYALEQRAASGERERVQPRHARPGPRAREKPPAREYRLR